MTNVSRVEAIGEQLPAFDLEMLQFNADGLIPAIVQDFENNQVLMMAWMNETALRHTLAEKRVTYWSRSRAELWRKGDTSGHKQYLKSVHYDCDGDTLLLKVEQVGAACHNGTRSCFDTGEISV